MNGAPSSFYTVRVGERTWLTGFSFYSGLKCSVTLRQATTLCVPVSPLVKRKHYLLCRWVECCWPQFIKSLNSLPTYELLWKSFGEPCCSCWPQWTFWCSEPPCYTGGFRASESPPWPTTTTNNFFSTFILTRSLHTDVGSHFTINIFPCSEWQKSACTSVLLPEFPGGCF